MTTRSEENSEHEDTLPTFAFAERIPADILALAPELVRFRRDIHQHPELGFETTRTCARIVEALARHGIQGDAERVPGGVIAVVEGNRPGPTIALRADMDALAMPDASGNPWQSEVPGRCHACGHDGHTTWLLGTLITLAQKNTFPGRVVGIFQPAEEIGRGARRVIECGVLDDFQPKEIYSAHGTVQFPLGKIGIQAGPVQASCDFFYITLKGKGAHAARPHTALDPIATAGLLSQALQMIVSRKVDPTQPAVVSICAVRAGDIHAPNVIPEALELAGTVRTFNPDVRALVETEMRRMSEEIAASQGLTAEVRVDHLTPALINGAVPAEVTRRVATRLLGDGCPQPVALSMAGEDFSEYANRIPGVHTFIGMADDAHRAVLHNPAFDFNDAVLPEAVWYLSETARTRLEELTGSTELAAAAE